MWRWYQLLLLRLEQPPKSWKKKNWRNWKSEEELGPYRQKHCLNQLEFLEDSWRPEDTCCYLESRERLLANAGLKNSQYIVKQLVWPKILFKKGITLTIPLKVAENWKIVSHEYLSFTTTFFSFRIWFYNQWINLCESKVGYIYLVSCSLLHW